LVYCAPCCVSKENRRIDINILLIDSDCCGLDLAWRAAEAGHAVRWWMPAENGRAPKDGDGFPRIEKVSSWKPHVAWADLIVNLYNDKKITAELDKFRAFGSKVFGPSVKSSELEWNRGKGMNLIEQRGLEVPEYRSFATFEEVLKAAWKAQDPFVFKQTGDAEDKATSYVPDSPEDLVAWLEAKKARSMKGPFILQEKVDLIAELGVSGWMGKDGFIGRFTVNHEFKKLLPGNYGPNTGEMGTVLKYVAEGKLLDDVLLPFEDDLVAMGHIGDVDINCGIKADGTALPFEWCNRFGWPSTQIAMACHLGDPVEWMLDAIEGRSTLDVDERVAVGVLMARPPFPNHNDDPRQSEGYLITGVEDVWDSVSPWQMMVGDGPVAAEGGLGRGRTYQTTGDYVLVAHALGNDVHDAIQRVYAVADRIKFADKIVRNDIGKRLESELPKLHALGYKELADY
jgi:phosphoribosylamine--glycine ligase